MPEFLTTIHINALLERIITSAQKEICLVSPYLQLSDNFRQRLQDAAARGVKITFVYGKGDLQEKKMQQLSKLNNLTLYYYHDLHAKCYFNENSLLISSMNMYEYSQKNREMRIGIHKASDPLLYQEARTESLSIIAHAELKRGLPKNQPTAAPADRLNYSNWRKALQTALAHSWGVKVSLSGEDGAINIKTGQHNLTCYIEKTGASHQVRVEKILTQNAYQVLSPQRYAAPEGYRISFDPGTREYYSLMIASATHSLRARTLDFIAPEEVQLIFDHILNCALLLDRCSKQSHPQNAWR